MLSPRLCPISILCPCLLRDLQLSRHELEQWPERMLGNAERDSGKTQVAEVHRKAEPIGCAAPLPYDCQVGFIQRVSANQPFLCIGQGKQTLPLGSGKNGAAGHSVSS